MTGKYRIKGVKREHGIITGLLPVLERIALNDDISAITPGRITVTRGGAQTLELRMGTGTISGLKVNARKGTTAQEVFLVTSKPDAVLAFLIREIPEFISR